MQQPRVRRARDSDAPAIRTVVERAIRYSTTDLYTAEQIDAWVRGGSQEGFETLIATTLAFVAESNGQVVGFSNLAGKDVDQLYVDPDFGGRGCARRLYEAVEAEAWRGGVRQLTATASLRALPVFRRFGFSEVGRADRSFNGESFPVVHMKKDLAGSV